MDSCTPSAGESLTDLTDLTLTFNEDVTVSQDAVVKVTCSDEDYATSTSLTADGKNVKVNFDNVPLYVNTTYNVVVPEGAITSSATGEAYKGVSLTYNGAKYEYFTYSETSPADGSDISYLNQVAINFDLEDGMRIEERNGVDFKLYEGTPEDGELIGTYTGEVNSTFNGFNVSIKKFDLKPSTTYTLYLEKETFSPKYTNSAGITATNSLYKNAEFRITYHTAANMSGLAGVTPSGVEALDGSKNALRVTIPGYEFEGATYAAKLMEGMTGVTTETESYYVGILPVTNTSSYLTAPVYSGGEKVGDVKLKWEANPASDYEVWLTGYFDGAFYSDKEYSLVIPAGVLAPSTEMASFAGNAETTLTFTGKGDHSINITCGSVAANSTVSELRTVVFTTDEPVFSLKTPVMTVNNGGVKTEYTLTMFTTEDNTTGLLATLVDADGNGFTPIAGADCSLGIEYNTFNSKSDSKLYNQTVTVPFKGAEPETVEPEMVNVTLTVGDNASTVAQAVKGKAYTVTVTPETDWTVESLTVGGEDVTDDMSSDGTYTIAELTGDTEVAAKLSYAGELTFEDATTGIASVEGTDISAYSNGTEIVVEGLQAGDRVTVYTVGGMRIAAHEATHDSVRISAPTGATYIVKVNNHAIKLVH